MNDHTEDTEYSEFEGLSDSESSETMNGSKPTMEDQFAALLESNRLLQQAILSQNSRKQKVYIPMPEKFDGRVGDYIEAWLEQFETWFRHREQVEGTVKLRDRVETAIQNTKSGIMID